MSWILMPDRGSRLSLVKKARNIHFGSQERNSVLGSVFPYYFTCESTHSPGSISIFPGLESPRQTVDQSAQDHSVAEV